MTGTGAGAWSGGLPGLEAMGVRSVQTPALALMSVDQHAVPGVPVDLVDVTAYPLRYTLGLPAAAAGDGGL